MHTHTQIERIERKRKNNQHFTKKQKQTKKKKKSNGSILAHIHTITDLFYHIFLPYILLWTVAIHPFTWELKIVLTFF